MLLVLRKLSYRQNDSKNIFDKCHGSPRELLGVSLFNEQPINTSLYGSKWIPKCTSERAKALRSQIVNENGMGFSLQDQRANFSHFRL
ncbi:hypothetical protein L596_006429 [Steinernema carpocapsae]|uniref:Uncharacterized protein n=1 Tax=Steinernema carpocapsae TaxID=34508 RepID=A0A4U8V403_STECR|nr:hypothetical protein L596_006429 [Steinernema carpocapsae]